MMQPPRERAVFPSAVVNCLAVWNGPSSWIPMEAEPTMRRSDIAAWSDFVAWTAFRTAFRTGLLLAASLCWIALYSPAVSQTSDHDPNAKSSADPCQSNPRDRSKSEDKSENGANAEGGDNRRPKTASPDMERCKGVLTPPKTGDEEIEKPAPDTGTTPVIPPGKVPEQAPK
ncbi:hypothetical protein [Labrys okinawensis]|uniref:hypothetical protein n=1 Tax=Labrys okinawensis TaxID=346911 RepID=UPI0011B23DCD|nr:hypothetical protein [Labrys okinawensis]